MSMKTEPILLPDEDRELLERFKRVQKAERRFVFRASIILTCSSRRIGDASELHTKPNYTIQWWDRCLRIGIKGLYYHKRTWKPKKYPANLKNMIVKFLETDPPLGHALWNSPLITEKLIVLDDTV